MRQRNERKFWAIETGPGALLVDEVVVTQAVSRILGVSTAEALCLFTSRITLDGFMESFLSDTENSTSRQELESAFKRELEEISMATAEKKAEEMTLRFPTFTPRELLGALKDLYSDLDYVVLDPDTPEQQVWSIEQFRAYVAEHIG